MTDNITTIIEQDLITTVFYYAEEKQFFVECFDNFTSLCKEFSINHAVDHKEEYGMFTVLVCNQKIVLDSVDTNTLFEEILSLFDYDMKYACIGGKCCGMSISVTEKE
jgi:hypothetical protein